MQDLEVGAVIAGRYRLESRLAEGGMGVVWAARHLVTRKRVALKVLKGSSATDPAMRHRVLREARAASAVRHPHVVDVYDVVEDDDGAPVLVMDLLVGESLRARLSREGKLSLEATAEVMVPVVSALGAAHSLGIVHRDLKPENVLLTRDSRGAPVVKVVDFGVAKLTATEGDLARSADLTALGTLVGTPYYMAPEQIWQEDTDHRADVWALGIVLYEFPLGKTPEGIFDLAGNVWEWTSSPFCPYPQHDCQSEARVFRGGGFATRLPANVLATTRLYSRPDYRYRDVGFRCVSDRP